VYAVYIMMVVGCMIYSLMILCEYVLGYLYPLAAKNHVFYLMKSMVAYMHPQRRKSLCCRCISFSLINKNKNAMYTTDKMI
jgi:hypothetical protein